jgi:hypothetical protein
MKVMIGFAVALMFAGSAAGARAADIPFVGCIEQGAQAADGSWTAPVGKSLRTSLPPAIADRLAVYASNWSAVLAPRGWACRSSVTALQGSALLVSPVPREGDDRAVLAGPAIILWNDERPEAVAAYAGRYFPGALRAILADDDVCGAGCAALLDPKSKATLTPLYRSDTIRHVKDLVVEYQTPANRAGLGHQIGAGAALPAYGVLAISNRPRGQGGVVNLTLRLPAALAPLRGAILSAFEACLPDRNAVDCESGGAFVAQGRPIDDGD